MGDSLFDDMMAGAVVAKHLFRGASKMYAKTKQFAESEKGQQLKAELKAKTNEAIEFAGDKAKEMGLEEKAKQVLESASDKAKEMGLEEKAKQVLGSASDKAKEMGLEEKAKQVLGSASDKAKEMGLEEKAKQVLGSANDKAKEMGFEEKAKSAIGLATDKVKEMGLEAKAKYALEFAKEMLRNPNPYPDMPDVAVIVYGPGGYAERISALENRITEETAKHRQTLADLNEKLANAPEYIVPGEDDYTLEDMPTTANVYEDLIREEQENFEANIYHLQRELEELKEELEEGLFMERQRRMEEDAYFEEQRRKEESKRDWARFLGLDPDEYK